MKKTLLILTVLFLISCGGEETTNAVSESDRKELYKLHENYKTFWLQNDSAKVINLFSENGAIIPPNNKRDFVKGKKAIGAWWFTANGDTTYPITSFIYKNDSLIASGNLATWEGLSEVGWVTMVKDSVLSAHTSTSNFVTVCKKENGEWKIFRQIWNVKPKQ